MNKADVLISLEIDADITAPSCGQRLMEALIGTDARLTPEGVSTGSERCRDPFESPAEFAARWWAIPARMYVDKQLSGEYHVGPFWRRRGTVRSTGHVSHGFINKKGERTPTYIWANFAWKPEVCYEALFRHRVGVTNPTVAMLHLFHGAGARRARTTDEMDFRCVSFGGKFRPGIPDAGWGMAFAKTRFASVDWDGLRFSGFVAQETSELVVSRLTERLADVADDPESVEARRTLFKSKFPPGIFR